jgi:hypothetical protein
MNVFTAMNPMLNQLMDLFSVLNVCFGRMMHALVLMMTMMISFVNIVKVNSGQTYRPTGYSVTHLALTLCFKLKL